METAQLYGIGQTGCMLYLAGLSALDIRKKRLPVWTLAAGGVLAVIFQILWKGLPGILIAAGGVVGIVFLAVSWVTEESFGYGDSILIGILGIYLGFWNLLNLLAVSFTIAAGVAMAVLVKQKFQRKTLLPFVPFLGAGYMVLLILGGF